MTEVSDEVQQIVNEMMKAEPTREYVPVDMNGHAGVTMNPTDISHWRRMDEHWREKGYGESYPIKNGLLSSWECSYCLERPDFEFTDETQTELRVTTPCPHSEGITTVTEFTVTSGKIICDDSLGDVYTIPDEIDDKFASYNTAVGVAQVIEENARMGCCYNMVWNSCPSLFQTGDGAYVIANLPYSDDGDDDPTPEGWTALTWFCTDLWAASIADYQDFLNKGGTPIEEKDQNGTRSVIDFPNGTYRVTHHSGEAEFDRDGYDGKPVIYTHLEKI